MPNLCLFEKFRPDFMPVILNLKKIRSEKYTFPNRQKKLLGNAGFKGLTPVFKL